MAQLVGSDLVVVIDCDDTLVMWNESEHWLPGPDKVCLQDPYDQSVVYLVPHKQHINLIKKYKKQGYTVIVWSAAGALWAKEVVDQLKLNDLVDLVMSKPIKYVDDLKAAEILGSRVYIPFKHVDRVIEPGDHE